jgi:phage terminase large subunit-like protein
VRQIGARLLLRFSLGQEPPQDIWVEGLMRTMVKQGLALLTFTPLSGWSDVVEEFLGIEGAGSLPLPAAD